MVVVVGVVIAWRGTVRHDKKLLAENAAEYEAEHGRLEVEPAEESPDVDA